MTRFPVNAKYISLDVIFSSLLKMQCRFKTIQSIFRPPNTFMIYLKTKKLNSLCIVWLFMLLRY